MEERAEPKAGRTAFLTQFQFSDRGCFDLFRRLLERGSPGVRDERFILLVVHEGSKIAHCLLTVASVQVAIF